MVRPSVVAFTWAAASAFLLAVVGCASAQDGVTYEPNLGIYTVEYVDDSGVTRQMEIVPPNRVAPSLEVDISDTGTGFEYRYSISNGTGSLIVQAISRIEIDCPGSITGDALSTPTEWFGRSRTSVHTNRHVCQFVARRGGISPGMDQAGFLIESGYLPSMVDVLVWGRRAGTETYPGLVDARPELIEVVRQVNGRDGGWFEAMAVAPAINPDAVLDPTEGIGVLQSTLGEACASTWIDDSNGICHSLEVKLQQAEASILADRPAARYQVQSFLNELDAQRGQYVDENAYWLLKVLGEHVLATI